jgi:hypothetical protein
MHGRDKRSGQEVVSRHEVAGPARVRFVGMRGAGGGGRTSTDSEVFLNSLDTTRVLSRREHMLR